MSDFGSEPEATSETSTLLDSSTHLPSDDRIQDADDKPIHVDAFLAQIRLYKLLLILPLAASCALDALLISQVADSPSIGRTGSIGQWRLGCHIAALACRTSTLLFLLLTYLRPITTDLGRNLRVHVNFCQSAFLLLLFASIANTLPWASFVLAHHRGPPSEGYLGIACQSIGLIAFLVAGCIKRGPRFRYDPALLGTGFGVGNGVFGEQAPADESNVVDWSGCAMLSYVTLFYNAGVAVRSTQVPQLEPRDVPFLGEPVRMQRYKPSMLLDGSMKDGKVDEWMMFVTMYWPLRWIIAECWAIETVGLLFDFAQIAVVHQLIGTFGSDDPDNAYAYLCCIALFVCQVMSTALSALVSAKESYQLAEPLRSLFYTTIFRKILVSRDAKAMNSHNLTEEEREQNKGRAQILNIINRDVFDVAVAGKKVWHFSNALGSFVMGTAMLYYILGVSALVGVGMVLLAAPLAYYLGRTIYRADRIQARSIDARVSSLKEYLDFIKVIKLNAWEGHYIRRISRLRDIELKWIRWRYHLGTCFNIMVSQIPLISLAAMFYFHTYVFGNRLTPATGFVAYNVFDKVKSSMSDIPNNVQVMLKIRIALQRIFALLNQEDIGVTDQEKQDIKLDNATLTWPADDPEGVFRLKGVNCQIPRGFTLVCGPLGSGKSLLLQAILGEAVIEEGRITAPQSRPENLPLTSTEWTGGVWMQESVAYAPQVSYIRHGTIRENVVFGQPFWEERYWEVIRQTGLEPDIALLEDGDLTEVGEGGVTLSGGQKARINLARCIYSRARTLLLDDILSAVDAHTAQHIFTECLTGSLLQDRTLVLVTHQVGLCLSGASFVISLRDGKVEQACNAREAKLVDLDGDNSDSKRMALPHKSISYHNTEKTAKEDNSRGPREIYVREKRELGHVKSNHYVMVFASSGGWIYWGIMIGLILGAKGIETWRQYVLKQWTEQLDNDHLAYFLPLYIGATAISAFIGAARWVLLYGVGNYGIFNRACRVIHSTIFVRISAAPLRFFDTTPKGRLLNLFTSDMGKIDGWVADATGRAIFIVTNVGVSVILVCILEPRVIWVIVALIIPFRWTNGILRKLRADIRRLHATLQSPLSSLYTDTIDGVVMIRAFGLQDLYNQSLVTLKDQEVKVGLLSWFVYLWARVIINTFSAVILMGTGFLLVNGDWTAAQAGFILTFAMMVSNGIYGLLEQAADMEETFVSAERLNQYMQMDEQESTEGAVPPEQWPQSGAISIRDLHVRYSDDLPPVLHGINLDIAAGERVGLVGATGSGKSTLALSIFRGNKQFAGSIKIDGVDIGSLALKELRSRLNMVVQESTLCSGTLRDALDISGERDDHEVYEALKRVHLLDDDPTNQFANLDAFVASEGSNFSQGQRQLMCLARALLKQSKVLVMDEATSSVDYETDAKITATVNECFTGVTMLVIAHRLATIMHYDKVVVLDAGKILELGRPADLIADPSSRFHSLCQAQAVDEYNRLLSLCKK